MLLTILVLTAAVASSFAVQSTYSHFWKHNGKTYFNGKFEIVPTSNVNGWTAILTFNSPTKIDHCYHGDLITSGYQTVHRISNKSWNADVAAGSTLSVKFQAKTSASTPTIAEVLLEGVSSQTGSPTSAPTPAPTSTPTPVPSSATPSPTSSPNTVQSTYSDFWDQNGKTYFNGKFEIVPTNSVNGWTAKLTFKSPTEIIVCHHGIIITSGYQAVHRISNKSWNADVAAGSTLKVQFQARTSASKPTIADVILEGVTSQGGGHTAAPTPTPTPAPSPAPTPAPSPAPTAARTYPTKSPSSGGDADKYSEVLGMSILFYEAQRSGDLPGNNRILWRGDSALDDKDGSLDLTGGYYDAGDYVKFNFPMAWSLTTIAWGILEFKDAYLVAGEYDNALAQIKWGLDYLLKCHSSGDELYVQVGNGDIDHAYFGRPEEMTMNRPTYKITTTKPGSDVAAETAAAMAAGYLLFKDSSPIYANTLKTHAIQLFDFAKKYKGKYSEGRWEFNFYSSSGYWDELAWASAWLYRVTNEDSYKTFAEHIISQLGNSPAWAFSWDNKKVGAEMLLYQLTNNHIYKSAVESFLQSWKTGGSLEYTPQGLAWRNEWGPNRYSANTAAIALLAAKKGINTNMGSLDSKAWAIHQVDLMLGGAGRSYVVGYGPDFPKRPHHRASACPEIKYHTCDQSTFNDESVNNPNILKGALVGGPAKDGSYKDERGDYKQSEVAVDYNAGWQTAVAGLIHFNL